jgi:hypothetical protein
VDNTPVDVLTGDRAGADHRSQGRNRPAARNRAITFWHELSKSRVEKPSRSRIPHLRQIRMQGHFVRGQRGAPRMAAAAVLDLD